MGKTFSKRVLGVSLGLLILASPLSASAQTRSVQSLKDQRTALNQKTTQLKNELANNQSKIHTLTGKITSTQIKIGETQAKISSLNSQISDTQDRINKRTQILKQQVAATYVQGTTPNLLQLLLDSNNFSEFVTRAYAVYKITNHQQDLINQQREDQQTLQNEQKQLAVESENTQKDLMSLKQFANDLQSTVAGQQDQLKTLNGKKASIDAQIQASIMSVSAAPKASAPVAQQGSVSSTNSTAQTVTSSAPTQAVSVTIPQAATSGTIADLVSNSSKYIGHSTYVFGGGRTASDIANGRFDCSGYVHWAYDSIGIDLGGWTTSTLQYVGSPVSPSNMQPGDLVFFNTYEPNGHVGIYIGNGQFIGSQSSTGVAIASLSNPYWSAHFSGTVRRILN